jgi:hypothetical protein
MNLQKVQSAFLEKIKTAYQLKNNTHVRENSLNFLKFLLKGWDCKDDLKVIQ